MTPLDLVFLGTLLAQVGLAWFGAHPIWLGLACWLVLPFTVWPWSVDPSEPIGRGLAYVTFSVSVALIAMRGSGRLPARDARSSSVFFLGATAGYVLWRLIDPVFWRAMVQGDAWAAEWLSGIVLVAGLGTAAVLLKHRSEASAADS